MWLLNLCIFVTRGKECTVKVGSAGGELAGLG
uniref:Uncharacterized protein n=1 Tax=Anguilla anguilla TaxID=7936 RepID=A0A0E9V8S9_ANGAN